MSDPQEAATCTCGHPRTEHAYLHVDGPCGARFDGCEKFTAAIPSDPHSAEARAKYPETEWTQKATVLAFREAFDAGRVSRDAEVAELKAKIAELTDLDIDAARQSLDRLADKCLWMMGTGEGRQRVQEDHATLGAVLAAIGSASSPVEGGGEPWQPATVA